MPRVRKSGEGAIYPIRGGKLFRVVVDGGFDEEGNRIQHTRTAATRRLAVARLEDLKREIDEHGAPLAGKVAVAQVAAQWLEVVKRDVDPNTFRGYRGAVGNWINPTIGTKQLSVLKPSDVRAVHLKIKAAGRGKSTALTAHVALSQLLDYAVAEKMMRRNVAKDVKRPGRKVRTAVARVDRDSLPTGQVVAILKAAAALPDGTGSRWWFKILAGQRQGEILGATLADLDLGREPTPDDPGRMGLYLVNWKLEELRREHGCDGTCGRKQPARCPQARWLVPEEFEMVHLTGAWHLTRPKSKTGRPLPLGFALCAAIRRHLDLTAEWPNPHGLIWRNPDGSPILPKQDNAEWKALLLAAGIDEASITGHWTRHTFDTTLLGLDVDPRVVAEIAGHDPRVALANYSHLHDDDRAHAALVLERAWSEGLA